MVKWKNSRGIEVEVVVLLRYNYYYTATTIHHDDALFPSYCCFIIYCLRFFGGIIIV